MRNGFPLLALVSLLVAAFAGCFGTDVQPSLDDPSPIDNTQRSPLGTSVFPGNYSTRGAYSHVLREGTLEILPVEVALVPSTLDGATIQIGLYRPQAPEGTRVPVIVDAGPYYGNYGPPVTELNSVSEFLVENFVPHGYAVALLTVRGTGDHGGCMDLMGPKEQHDLDQAITWLGTQAWSNGNVAMTGASYDGSTPWEVASHGNPHLKTIVPVSGLTDLYGLMFRNGTAEWRAPLAIEALYYTFGFTAAGRSLQHNLEGVLCPESFQGFVAGPYSAVTGERDPTGFWAARNFRPGVLEKYKGSVLLVHGLQDWNVEPHMGLPFVQQLHDTKGNDVKMMLGQWGHTFPDWAPDKAKRWDWAEILLHWFDYHLKGDTSIDLGPPVQVQDSTGRWRDEGAWPPQDATWQTFHLATGKLQTQTGAAGSTLLVPTPSNVGILLGDCTDPPMGLPDQAGAMADFATDPLSKSMQVAGLPLPHLTVTPLGPGGFLSAFLLSKDKSGHLKCLGWTSMDLRFADGGETMRTVVPGQPLVARLQVQPMDAVVPANHSLVLRLWQMPYSDHQSGTQNYPLRVEWGASTSSTLRVPTIERGLEYFFEPPKGKAGVAGSGPS